MKLNQSQLFSAAVAGILGSAIVAAASSSAFAADAKDAKMDAAKGKCVGANSCKGKTACSTAGANECAGKNGCKGKGWVEKTKTDCDAMAKKDKKVKFEAMNK